MSSNTRAYLGLRMPFCRQKDTFKDAGRLGQSSDWLFFKPLFSVSKTNKEFMFCEAKT
jgi:hypothetical protein